MLEYLHARLQHRLSSGLTWSELVAGSWCVASDEPEAHLVWQGELYQRRKKIYWPVSAPILAVASSWGDVHTGSDLTLRVLCRDGRQYSTHGWEEKRSGLGRTSRTPRLSTRSSCGSSRWVPSSLPHSGNRKPSVGSSRLVVPPRNISWRFTRVGCWWG